MYLVAFFFGFFCGSLAVCIIDHGYKCIPKGE